jgi:hypothetical protein
MHFDKLISKSTNKSRATWNIVKTITNNKDSTNNVTTMNINNTLTSNPLSIANAFNSYFSTVAKDLITKNFSGKTPFINNDPLTFLRQNLNKSFPYIKLKNTTTFEISEIINSLKRKDSHGYDEVSTRVLKISNPYITSPLTYIFNKTLATGIFPDRLKFSEVKPLFKKRGQNRFY